MFLFSKQSFVFAGVFLAAFLFFFATSIPLDLLASRLLFSRIQALTGMSVDAESIGLGFPFSLVARNITLSNPSRKTMGPDIPASMPKIAEARITPGFGLLRGNKSGDIAIRLGASEGALSASIDENRFEIDGRDIDIAMLDALLIGSDWNLRGKSDFKIEFSGDKLQTGEGHLTLALKNLSSNHVHVLGINFPDLNVSKFDGAMKLSGGRMEIEHAKSTGGNIGVELTGSLGLGAPLQQSTIALLTKVTPTPALETALGSVSGLLTQVKKPDGSIHIATEGAVTSPVTGFR